MEAPHELSQTTHQRKSASNHTTQEAAQQPQTPNSNPILTVNFSWKKLKARITSKETPNTPLYIVDAPFALKSPHLTFRHDTPDGKGETFGTGTLHLVSIHADVTLHNRPLQLVPLKKFKTSYTHLSKAYSDTDDLVPMTWTTTLDLKTWEFICLDEKGIAVAKLSARVWATSKLGTIEFLGEKSGREEWREEIVVVVSTLYYLMLMRSNNVLSLVGSVFAKTGKGKVGE